MNLYTSVSSVIDKCTRAHAYSVYTSVSKYLYTRAMRACVGVCVSARAWYVCVCMFGSMYTSSQLVTVYTYVWILCVYIYIDRARARISVCVCVCKCTCNYVSIYICIYVRKYVYYMYIYLYFTCIYYIVNPNPWIVRGETRFRSQRHGKLFYLYACPAFLTYSTVPPTTTTTTTAMRTTEYPNDHTTAPQQSIRNNGPGPISSELFLTQTHAPSLDSVPHFSSSPANRAYRQRAPRRTPLRQNRSNPCHDNFEPSNCSSHKYYCALFLP